MGLSSNSTTSNDAVQICIFDNTRGLHEGHEVEKILFFYPSDLPISNQLTVIGLHQGLITFTRNFSPDAGCEVIEAERHSHVFYEAEPDIWMVMVVEKNNLEAIWRVDALRSILKEVHSLFVMFNGSLRAMLDEQPNGDLLRSSLYIFITDYLYDFFVGKKLHLPSFRDSLREQGTVQMLTVGREAAIEVQSLVRVLESSIGGTQSQSLILFHDLLVSTTLPPDDTVTLFTYALMRMTPRAMSSHTSSWSYLRKGSTAANLATGSVLATSSSASEQLHSSRDTSPSGTNSYLTARPLKQGRWHKGKDGFLVTETLNGEVHSLSSATPSIKLQHSDERMYLCAHRHKNLTIILLVPVASISSMEQAIPMIKQRILDNASLRILKVEEKLSKGWGGENAYHVAGYRYLLVDGDRSVSRASPSTKVTTLSKESLIAMNKLREEVDQEKCRAKLENALEKDFEVCIRAKNNAWVIARVTRGKELYMVLEKASETLLYAADSMEKFSNRYCNGAFSLD